LAAYLKTQIVALCAFFFMPYQDQSLIDGMRVFGYIVRFLAIGGFIAGIVLDYCVLTRGGYGNRWLAFCISVAMAFVTFFIFLVHAAIISPPRVQYSTLVEGGNEASGRGLLGWFVAIGLYIMVVILKRTLVRLYRNEPLNSRATMPIILSTVFESFYFSLFFGTLIALLFHIDINFHWG